MKVILELTPGNNSFFDPISRMHFHRANKIQEVPDGVDTKNLQRAVKLKTLNLLQGNFESTEEQKKVGKPTVQKPVEDKPATSKVAEHSKDKEEKMADKPKVEELTDEIIDQPSEPKKDKNNKSQKQAEKAEKSKK